MLYKFYNEKELNDYLRNNNDRISSLDLTLKQQEEFIVLLRRLIKTAEALNAKYSMFPLFYVQLDDDNSSSLNSNYMFTEIGLYFDAYCLSALRAIHYQFKQDFKTLTFYYKPDSKNPDELAYYYHYTPIDFKEFKWAYFRSPEDYGNSKYGDIRYYQNEKINSLNLTWFVVEQLLNEDLLPVILIDLNLFDNEQLLQTNPFYINTIHTNTLNRTLQQKSVQRTYEHSSVAQFLNQGFIHYKKHEEIPYRIDDHDVLIGVDNSVYGQNNSATNQWIVPQATWFNSLHYYNLLNYANDSQTFSANDVLKDYKAGTLDLNDIKTMTQNLDFSAGLKHGTSYQLFTTNEPTYYNNTHYYTLTIKPNTTSDDSEIYFSNKIATADPTKPLLVRTLSFKAPNNTINIISLTVKDQLAFLKALIAKINFSKIPQSQNALTAYPSIQHNLDLLKSAFSKHLINLPTIFKTRTVNVSPELSFKQDPNSKNFHRSQAFLTFSPLINPTFNYHTFSHTNLQESVFRTDVIKFDTPYLQDINYPTLAFSSSFLEVTYEMIKQQNVTLNDVLITNFYVLGYLNVFFSRYVFFSKKFGYILHEMNHNNLLYGYIVLNQTDTVSNKDINDAYSFYDRLLTCLYEAFLSTDFLDEVSALISTTNPTALHTGRQVIPDRLMQAANASFKDKELTWFTECYNMGCNNIPYFAIYSPLRDFECKLNDIIIKQKSDAWLELITKYIKQAISKIPDLEIKTRADYLADLKNTAFKNIEDAPQITLTNTNSTTNYSNFKKNRL